MSSRNIVFAAAGVSGGTATYIEDVFSTYLYTGTGATQSINNGIDLAGKGGLVWTKRRSGVLSHYLVTTPLGTNNYLSTDSTNAQGSTTNLLTPTSTGFDFSSNTLVNANTASQVAWTFAKQAKFFDIVQLNSSQNTYSHSLGSTPGCIMVKCTDASGANWVVYHRSLTNPNNYYIRLNTGDTEINAGGAIWGVTDTTFTVSSGLWANGTTGIAYLFAHNAGGFGESGTENVISCGTYTGTGTSPGPTVNLGFEPQFLLIKNIDASPRQWFIQDVMRGMSLTDCLYLQANSSTDENDATVPVVYPTATGFVPYITSGGWNGTGERYIYIAIRRPMKVPTDATTVFSPQLSSASTGTQINTGTTIDWQTIYYTPGLGSQPRWVDRLRGVSSTTTETTPYLKSSSTAAEVTGPDTRSWNNTGFAIPSDWSGASTSYVNFSRRPGFFDVVCWGGSGANVNHNLGVAPQLVFYKTRSQTSYWGVYCSLNSNPLDSYLFLQTTGALEYAGQAVWQNMTSTTFGMTSYIDVNATANVAYLFATCPGVSKVGSYTGTNSTQTINCGFGAGGARFLLVKRTDSTSNWFAWDSANGFTSSSSPYNIWNTGGAQVSGNNGTYAASTGFTLTSGSPVNASGGTYIYLAIA